MAIFTWYLLTKDLKEKSFSEFYNADVFEFHSFHCPKWSRSQIIEDRIHFNTNSLYLNANFKGLE
jgi:hypothetical protein